MENKPDKNIPTLDEVLAKHSSNFKKYLDKDYGSKFNVCINGFEAQNAMQEWASIQSRECAGWVKASEPPKNDEGDCYFVKVRTNYGIENDTAYLEDGKFPELVIEWLDETESIEPCATSSEIEELKKDNERLRVENVIRLNRIAVLNSEIEKLQPSPTGDRDDEWMKENPPFAAPYPKEKRFYIDEVGELLRKHKVGELSISKMTEILNEKIK